MRSAVVLLALAMLTIGLVVPASAPVVGPLAYTEDAEARRCIIGSSGDCIIPIYCVMEPCWDFP